MSERKDQTMDMDKAEDDLRLTPKQAAFVREFCKDSNATQAAVRSGYSAHTAQEQGSRLLSKAMIKEAVERRMTASAALAEVDAALVVRELFEVATADPRDLVSLHRGACRFCFGIDNDRAWTLGEYRDAFYAAKAADPNAEAPPMRGGTGYDFTAEPNPECGECRSFGAERVFVKDTRKMTRAAAKLLAGIKQSRDGSIELKQRDQDGAVIALGRVVGLFRDRQEISGHGGGPIGLTAVPLNTLTNDQLKEILRRSGHPALELREGTTNDHA